ncbi:MAG: hypothetical protein PWR01_4724 [Clostridiales bacterium]|jgi:hypothetical protein|nr:hypothetical protein [Clostridiales bacterium]MDN5283651.1 hypothetical protein [Candidatus Ozemobacter sp.]
MGELDLKIPRLDKSCGYLHLLVVASEWKQLFFALQKDAVELFKLSFAMIFFS